MILPVASRENNTESTATPPVSFSRDATGKPTDNLEAASPRDSLVENVVGNFVDSAARPTCNPPPPNSAALSRIENPVSSITHLPEPSPEPLSKTLSESSSAPNGPPSRHRRTGTIARLHKDVRRQINEMLDDGYPYKTIIKAVGDVGVDLNEDMMTRWKQGGYQDYLREQRLIDQCRMRTDRAYELMASPQGANGFQATQQLAAAQICEAVAEMGPDTLREALSAKPLNYFRMLNSFSRLTNGGLKCERHLTDEAERQAEIQARNAPPRKAALSDEAVKEMIEKLHLL